MFSGTTIAAYKCIYKLKLIPKEVILKPYFAMTLIKRVESITMDST